MAKAKYMVDLAAGCGPYSGARVRMVARARVLLRAEEGYTDGHCGCAGPLLRWAGFASALEQALREQPRPGQRRKLSEARSPCDRGGMHYPA